MPTTIMLRRFVRGTGAGDDPLVAYGGASTALGNARFLYADRLGSIVLHADAAGTSTTVNAYDEYGVADAPIDTRFGYTGQAWVPEAGLYYYKARMYSPNACHPPKGGDCPAYGERRRGWQATYGRTRCSWR